MFDSVASMLPVSWRSPLIALGVYLLHCGYLKLLEIDPAWLAYCNFDRFGMFTVELMLYIPVGVLLGVSIVLEYTMRTRRWNAIQTYGDIRVRRKSDA